MSQSCCKNVFNAYYFPHGRVVYDTGSRKHEFLADICIIENEDMISQIMKDMKLPQKNTIISFNPNFLCYQCKKKYK
jgi:hypothetical protein